MSQVGAKAQRAQGFDIAIQDKNNPEVWISIEGVRGWSGLDGEASEQDATTLKSQAMEYTLGLRDFGNFNLDVNYLFDDAGQEECRDAQATSEARRFLVIYSNGYEDEFDALVKGAPMSGAVNQNIEGSLSLRITGAVVRRAPDAE